VFERATRAGPPLNLLWSGLAAARPLAHVGQLGLLFLAETGLLLTKVGFVLDMFVLDVFRRFVLGMFFFFAGLSACHWFLLRTRLLLRSAKTTHLPGDSATGSFPGCAPASWWWRWPSARALAFDNAGLSVYFCALPMLKSMQPGCVTARRYSLRCFR
jgi:hypothetical protein